MALFSSGNSPSLIGHRWFACISTGEHIEEISFSIIATSRMTKRTHSRRLTRHFPGALSLSFSLPLFPRYYRENNLPTPLRRLSRPFIRPTIDFLRNLQGDLRSVPNLDRPPLPPPLVFSLTAKAANRVFEGKRRISSRPSVPLTITPSQKKVPRNSQNPRSSLPPTPNSQLLRAVSFVSCSIKSEYHFREPINQRTVKDVQDRDQNEDLQDRQVEP